MPSFSSQSLPPHACIICDDFGLDPSTNEAILDLLAAGKAQGTSVLMTKEASFPQYFADLKALKQENPHLRIGLHLNLTEAPFLALKSHSRSLFSVFFNCALGRDAQYSLELTSQVKNFKTTFGSPSHIDGHQHIQYHPSVRALLLKTLADHNLAQLPLRLYPFQNKSFKASLMNLLAKKHLTEGALYDLQDIMEEIEILPVETQGHLEIMAHVGRPQSTQADKTVDFGSFSFENRVKQYDFLKNQP